MIVASWNIGGGILDDSSNSEGFRYYDDVIESHRPDILCIQEAHYFSSTNNSIQTFASLLGNKYYRIDPMSPSHLNEAAQLSLGIISTYPIISHEYVVLPNPGLEIITVEGRKQQMHDKGYTKTTLETPRGLINVVNAHLFPFLYFNSDATEPRFANIFITLEAAILEAENEHPTIVIMDLNSSDIGHLLPHVVKRLQPMLGRQKTTRNGLQLDFILADNHFVREESTVTAGRSSHYYCSVKLQAK